LKASAAFSRPGANRRESQFLVGSSGVFEKFPDGSAGVEVRIHFSYPTRRQILRASGPGVTAAFDANQFHPTAAALGICELDRIHRLGRGGSFQHANVGWFTTVVTRPECNGLVSGQNAAALLVERASHRTSAKRYD